LAEVAFARAVLVLDVGSLSEGGRGAWVGAFRGADSCNGRTRCTFTQRDQTPARRDCRPPPSKAKQHPSVPAQKCCRAQHTTLRGPHHDLPSRLQSSPLPDMPSRPATVYPPPSARRRPSKAKVLRHAAETRRHPPVAGLPPAATRCRPSEAQVLRPAAFLAPAARHLSYWPRVDTTPPRSNKETMKGIVPARVVLSPACLRPSASSKDGVEGTGLHETSLQGDTSPLQATGEDHEPPLINPKAGHEPPRKINGEDTSPSEQ